MAPIEKQIIFLVAERRFGNDCRILSAHDPDRALADLTALAESASLWPS